MPATSWKTRMPTDAPTVSKAIDKRNARKPKLCYIVGATGDDFSFSDADLEVASKQRAKDDVWQHADGPVVINGFCAADDVEGGDKHMQRQLMHYLASKPIEPQEGACCSAFTHTSNLTCMVASTETCYVDNGRLGLLADRPTARVLRFDSDALLKDVLAEEARTAGFFAPFGQRHVKKSMHVIANRYSTVDVDCEDSKRAYFCRYHVELRVLTGFGVMTALGELKLREPLEVNKVSYSAHINWHSWGFSAETCWHDGGRMCREVGYPF